MKCLFVLYSRCFCLNHFLVNICGILKGRAQTGQVQGLGDVLEIEENLVPGDDGVKIQERKSQGKSNDQKDSCQCF